MSSREKAADLVQETFFKAWDYLRAGKEIDRWKSFLFHVLNNLIIDEYRRKKEQSLDAMLEDETMEVNRVIAVDSRAEREQKYDTELLITVVRDYIPQLPEPQRSVITMRYIDDLSLQEIASALGISENVVSVRIHRAIAVLKQHFSSLPLS